MLGGMSFRQFVVVLAATAIAGLTPTTTAHGRDLTEEYNQARKIALKDPKVRAAFKRANDELDKRIMEIDPSLKPFVEKQSGHGQEGGPMKKPVAKTIHVVVKGETLTSIARRYRLGVQSLAQGQSHLQASHLQGRPEIDHPHQWLVQKS